ncbi:MAG: general stress protein 26 [Verrucomicrobiales bacterium]|jgi:general stress protein 26
MPAPPEPSFSPEELVTLAEETIAAAKFPQLASMEGDQPRLRPVSPVKVEGFTIHMANLRSYQKTQQIAANPKVELCYLAPNHDQVRITGIAKIEADDAVLEAIWENNPLLRKYLGSPQNPELVIYRIEPVQVRFMREWALQYHDVPFDHA